jgi:ribosomal protein S13
VAPAITNVANPVAAQNVVDPNLDVQDVDDDEEEIGPTEFSDLEDFSETESMEDDTSGFRLVRKLNKKAVIATPASRNLMAHLLYMCGVYADEAEVIAEVAGVRRLKDLADLKAEHISQIAKTVSTARRYRAKDIVIGLVTMRKVEALAWFVRDAIRRGKVPEANMWNVDKCRECMQLMDLEKDQSGDLTKGTHPGELKITKWVSWVLSLKNYLSTIRGASQVPLSYVLRDISESKKGPYLDSQNHTTRLVKEAVLKGPVFQADNRVVFQIIKACTLSTPSWDWIRSFNAKEDGRAAFAKLSKQYDGDGEIIKRRAQADQILKEVHYKCEHTFPFESFVTKLKGCFEVMAECDEPYTERAKVQLMCERIGCENGNVKTIKVLVMADPVLSHDFDRAASKISEIVASSMPAPGSNRYRGERRVAALEKELKEAKDIIKKGKFKGGEKSKGKRNEDFVIPAKYRGVDLSDINRRFSAEEWDKLSYAIRDKIRDTRDEEEEEESAPKKQRKVAATRNDNSDDDDDGGDDEELPMKSKDGPPTAKGNFGAKAYKRN